MAGPKSRLGRGLGGLISGSTSQTGSQPTKSPAAKKVAAKKAAPAKPAPTATHAPSSGYQEVTVKDVVPNPYQPRRDINPDQVEELASSIRSEGLLQPIVVRKKGDRFELIAGERRLRAYEHLKQRKIPARIIEASDASSATLALIENLQRENLNPIDEAQGYASLLRDFDLTQEAAAERVGKGRATVANALRLLTLSSEIQGFISRRLLSTGHAKVLLGLDEDEHRRLLARRIIETGMSVRDAEQQVKRLKEGASRSTRKKAVAGAEEATVRDLEKRVGDHLNAKVSIKHGAKKGRLTIEYLGNDDLARILDRLGIQS